MVTLWNRADHYIFALWFLLSFFLFVSSPNLSGQRLDVCHTSTHGVALVQIWDAGLKYAARGSLKIQDAKNRHLHTIVQLCRAISSQLRHVSTIWKNLLSSNISSRCPHNMVNFGLLAAEIVSLVWGTPATFNGFRVLAALLHSSQVVSVSQTLRHWTEGATYVWWGDHHVGHWPTFLLIIIHFFPFQSSIALASVFLRSSFPSFISPTSPQEGCKVVRSAYVCLLYVRMSVHLHTWKTTCPD